MRQETDRRKKILEILEEKGEATVKELSNIFNVSEMTIYRDVKLLEKEGLIKRKHGSVLLNSTENTDEKIIKTCPICEKPITRTHPYRIVIKGTRAVEACCEHCGLMLHQKYENEEVSAITYDFITEKPVNVLDAYYVVGSSAVPCCSPSVIPFISKDDAEKFQRGFGGKVMSFIQAYQEIINRMSLNVKSCCEDVFKIGNLREKNEQI